MLRKAVSSDNSHLVLQQAHQAQSKKQYQHAAELYLQYAQEHETDLQKQAGHILHAAQCFERQYDKGESAKYYLKAAELYSKASYLQHALSALKACFRVNNNKTLLSPTLRNLRTQGLWHVDMLELLPEEESVFHRIFRSDTVADTFFNTVTTFDEFQRLMQWMQIIHVPEGETFAKNNTLADSVYFIVSGQVEALIPQATRVDSMGYIESMEMFGEAEFFLDRKWIAEIVACTDCQFLCIPYHNISALKPYLPNLKPTMAKSYCHRILLRRLTVAPVFSELDQHVRTEISREISLVHLSAGECLFREGDKATHVYIVISGKFHMLLNIDDKDVVFKEIGSSATFGEIALINQKKRTATAIAVEESCLLRIPGTVFRETYEDSQELRWLLRVRKDFQSKELQQFIRKMAKKKDNAC